MLQHTLKKGKVLRQGQARFSLQRDSVQPIVGPLALSTPGVGGSLGCGASGQSHHSWVETCYLAQLILSLGAAHWHAGNYSPQDQAAG